MRRGFVQKTANKVVYNDGKHLLFAYPFLDVAAVMDILYISRSSAVRPTLHIQVHHNVTTYPVPDLGLWRPLGNNVIEKSSTS